MKKKNKLRTDIFTTIIVVLCVFCGLYIFATQTESYKFAGKFINNTTVINSIGSLKSIRLLSCSDRGDWAEYKIFVIGEKGKGTVYLNLKKSEDVWEVIKGNLVLKDGTVIEVHPHP